MSEWFIEVARRHRRFDVEVLDLKVIDLPLFAERNHPRLHQYEGEKQKAWSTQIGPLDAFVFVTPEYNFSMAPALVNAIDYLYVEWHHKPAAFVSYGGVSGGLRAVQMARQMLAAVKMVPIVEAVTIPFVAQSIDREAQRFKAADHHEKSALTMLDELHRWATILAPLRQS